jgi:signal transduction histidine kinase
LIAFYLFYILAAYLVVLPNMGIIKAKDFTLTLAVYVSIVSSALMTTLLMLRARNLNRQRAMTERQITLVNHQLEQEQDQRERQSQFISMLTHELKTPISVAKLSLDAMKTGGIEHDRIERALQNMNDVVERCRISDALEGRRFQILRESFDLRELVFERLDLLPTPERVKVFEGNNVFIDSDSQLISIIIANLLDNALKYSPDKSEVTVGVFEKERDEVSGASVLVTNLIGSSGEPDADRVFQKYYRAKKAEGKSGSGLGLYLTAGIADLLGGVVSFRSVDSRIEFELWVPN